MTLDTTYLKMQLINTDIKKYNNVELSITTHFITSIKIIIKKNKNYL